ncbi:fibronectin type III domain-containing protein, partial [Paenibacillus validus]
YLQEVNIYEAPDTAPPAVPYGLNSVAGDGSVTLTWSPVGDSDLKGYYVYKDSVKLNATPITSTSYTVTGLANGVAYNFQVSSVDIKNNESALSPVKTETPVSPPPPVPSGLEVTAGDKQAYLNWTANTDDTTKYHIYKNGVYLQTVTHPNTYYTATGLTNGTTYSFSITAMDAYGKESEKSAPVMVTPVEIPPTVPSGLTVTAGDGQAALTWLANTDDTTIYHIYLNGIYLNSVSHPTTSYTVTGLTNGTTYSFSISAEDEDGSESVKSEAVTVIPTEPLTQKPTGLKAIAGDGQVTLSWTANTDKTTKYHIYKNGVYLTTVTHPTTTYTVTGLSNGMQYSFTLKAEFASGQSSEASGAVNVTPAGPAPVTGIPAGGSANFGFSAADIFTNSVEIFGFLAAFVLLGIVFNQVAPKVFDLVRNSFK